MLNTGQTPSLSARSPRSVDGLAAGAHTVEGVDRPGAFRGSVIWEIPDRGNVKGIDPTPDQKSRCRLGSHTWSTFHDD
jgi:hypothetical protein